MKMSMDNGVTWSKERPLSGIEGVLVKNKPYLSEGGVLLLPIYDEKSWRPGLCRSEDGGRHWRLWLLEEAPGTSHPGLYCDRRPRCASHVPAHPRGPGI